MFIYRLRKLRGGAGLSGYSSDMQGWEVDIFKRQLGTAQERLDVEEHTWKSVQ